MGTQKNKAAPRRLKRAEAVLARRTSRFLVILDRCTDYHNADAVLRTAEALGIQNVWMVEQTPPAPRAWKPGPASKGAHRWLDIKIFPQATECINQLHKEQWEIWATDLCENAKDCIAEELPAIPKKIALVLGRESDGVSSEFLQAAEHRLRLPMHGFAESLNLSVAAGLFLAALFRACPEARGDISESQKSDLRQRWYSMLATSEEQREEFMRWAKQPPSPLEDPRPAPESRRPRVLKKAKKRYKIKRN